MVLVGSLLQTLIWCGPMTSPSTMRFVQQHLSTYVYSFPVMLATVLTVVNLNRLTITGIYNYEGCLLTVYFLYSPKLSTGLMLILTRLRVLDMMDLIDSSLCPLVCSTHSQSPSMMARSTGRIGR